jgi:hypothetical protein
LEGLWRFIADFYRFAKWEANRFCAGFARSATAKMRITESAVAARNFTG